MPAKPQQKRTIRSFVRRTGRLTPSQEKALEEMWPTHGIEHTESHLDFAALFERNRPVVLEIGFGNGETLVEMAAANPDANYLGIEVHTPGVGHCLLKAREAGVNNLRLIVHDALEVLNHQVPDSSLARVNLYFPDPWPKKRHHKRRIVQLPFLQLIANKLASNGLFNIATDWAEYAEHIDDIFFPIGSFHLCRQARTQR